MKNISDVMEKYIKKIDATTKVAFFSAILAAFISHLAYFIDRWANEDDFHEIMGQINMIGSGRWMPGTILSSNFLAPVVLFVIVMIFLGLISVMIKSLFKIKNKLYIVIISFMLASFPVLALGFGYGFMVERYILGMFFSILAVYLTRKYKFGFILGAVALAITMGYYQSYIAITMALSMLVLILDFIDNEETSKNIKAIGRYLSMGVIGVLSYLVLTKIICHITGTSLLDYKGINKMGSLPPLEQIFPLIKRTYYDFFAFFLGKKFLHPFKYGLIGQIVLCGINIFLAFYIIFKEKIYKRKLSFILLLILTLLIPLGFNAVDFMAYESETSSLNIYQFIFILIYPFVLLNRLERNDKSSNFVILSGWICAIASLPIMWNYFLLSNIYYLKINDYYTTTVQLTNRMYDRIEQVLGFNGNTKVMVGNKEGIYMDRRVYKEYYQYLTYDQGLWDQFIGYAPRPTGTDFKFHYLVENIIGVHLYSATPEEFDEIYNSDEYDQMAVWPEDGCIEYIDDILVVKIS